MQVFAPSAVGLQFFELGLQDSWCTVVGFSSLVRTGSCGAGLQGSSIGRLLLYLGLGAYPEYMASCNASSGSGAFTLHHDTLNPN